MTNKTENKKDIIAEIENYRTQIRKRILFQISEKRDQMKKEKRKIFEGKWISKEKIAEIQKAMKKRDRILLIEIFGIFLFMIATFLILLKGLNEFLLPK